MSLTQREIDDMTMIVNDANLNMREQQATIESQQQIIKLQEEMIALLKDELQAKSKFITILEKQLGV